jgi:site-specific recombinase XerD
MVLTNNDIENTCSHLVNHTAKFDIYSHIIFDTLYRTGLRINELLEYERVSLIDIDTVQVITQKFSNPRIIPLSDFNPIYIAHLASGQLPALIRSYSYYSSKMLIYNSLHPRLYIKNKQVTTHLFRHNYVKRLFDLGQTIEQISETIGEREPKNTLGYVYSQISSMR